MSQSVSPPTYVPSDFVAIPISPTPTVGADSFRSQALPLPAKRGEIGYNEEEHGQSIITDSVGEVVDVPSLTSRHPSNRGPSSPGARATDAPSHPSSHPTRAVPPPNAASPPVSGKRPLSLTSHFLGIRLSTFFLLAVHLVFLGGSIAAWVLSAKLLARSQAGQQGDSSTSSQDDGDTSSQDDGNTVLSAGGAGVVVHVLFGVAIFGQLLLLERRIFRVRAERYAHLHQSQMPTSSSRRVRESASMGLAPWNRPSLPTYAAALAASGLGTGDVEDHMIAAPPPPAYGNTRGSTLLLANPRPEQTRSRGFLGRSASSRQSGSRSSGRLRGLLGLGRPASARSADEIEVVSLAQRALALEQTLARLEEGQATQSASWVPAPPTR